MVRLWASESDDTPGRRPVDTRALHGWRPAGEDYDYGPYDPVGEQHEQRAVILSG